MTEQPNSSAPLSPRGHAVPSEAWPHDLTEFGAPEIDSAGVRLRPPDDSDVAAFVAAGNDPEIVRWVGLPQPYGEEEAARFIHEIAPGERRSGQGAHFTVTVNDETIGTVGVHSIDSTGSAAVGFWLLGQARGTGVATPVLRTAIDWAFDRVGLHGLAWNALVGNVNSLRLVRACGFTPDGTLRRAILHRGVIHDCWAATLLPDRPWTPAASTARPEAGTPAGASVAATPAATPLPTVRDTMVEIAAGAWQLQPVDAAAAAAAEDLLPVSAALPLGLWAVREATTGDAVAYVGLLTRSDLTEEHRRGWLISASHESANGEAEHTGREAIARYAQQALDLDIS